MAVSDNRWSVRPEGSNWGDFGPEDQLGRLNLVTADKRREAAAEVREGLAFCLSLPLDCPSVPLTPVRHPPQIACSGSEDHPVMNFPCGHLFPGMKQVACDDGVTLSLQYSTQWDALCHMGFLYDATGTGAAPKITYYNGYTANDHIRGPYDYLEDKRLAGPYGAMALGIERMAETAVQTRGVMVDLMTHVGRGRIPVGYDRLMRIMDADGVEIEPGDALCLRTGFDRALLAQYADPSIAVNAHDWPGLDGFDDRLLQWITDSGLVALVSDNEAVEVWAEFPQVSADGVGIPLHHHCLFKLGIPLGEMFLLSDLADWLRSHGRSRFLFTAPPLRLPGAVGSPATGVGTV